MERFVINLFLTDPQVLVAAAVSAAVGQLMKPFTSTLFYGNEFNFKTALQAGGFPSTHSSVRSLSFYAFTTLYNLTYHLHDLLSKPKSAIN